MEFAERIGRRLKQLREERGWTQQTLAGKAGVSQSTVAGVETGAQLPGATLLGRLSELFRVNLDFFYREKENPFRMLLRAEDVKAEDVATLRTIEERCELAARLVDDKQPAVVWCHLNDEGDILQRMIPDCVQVSGATSDDDKEAAFLGFSDGSVRVLVI